MTGIEVAKNALISTQAMLGMYVSDLSDEDLLVHPVPGANNIAWQLQHLISSEVGIFAEQIPNAEYPEIPAELKNDSSGSSSSKLSKAEYLEWFNTVRNATIANLDRMSDADLDKPNTGSLSKMAPTLGALFILAANHVLMHAGQFTVLRRKLGKPVLF